MDRGNPTRSHCCAMLICGCAGSINSRFASGGKTSFFFHPVQLHLALSNVLVELGLERLVLVLPLCSSCRENLGHLLLEAMFPRAICVGCTPYVLAHSFTVLSPLSASSATRALNSALYCFRCVDIDLPLLSLSH